MNLSFLEKKYTAKLLLSLFKNKQQRFKDMKKTIPREATLSARIKELEDLGLIQSTVTKEKRRKFFAYNLTQKGQKIGASLHEIESI